MLFHKIPFLFGPQTFSLSMTMKKCWRKWRPDPAECKIYAEISIQEKPKTIKFYCFRPGHNEWNNLLLTLLFSRFFCGLPSDFMHYLSPSVGSFLCHLSTHQGTDASDCIIVDCSHFRKLEKMPFAWFMQHFNLWKVFVAWKINTFLMREERIN